MAPKKEKNKKYIPGKAKELKIAISILAVLLVIGGVWAFFTYHDFSPVKAGHYDDTVVATLTYTDESGREYTRQVTYAEVRYYVKQLSLTPNQAIEAIQEDWVPEVMAQIYGISLTAEDKADKENELLEYMGFCGEGNYELVLAGQFMTKALHDRFLYLKYLTARVHSNLCENKESPLITGADKESVDAFLTKHFFAAKHIYIPAGNNAQQTIEQARDKLLSGESFDNVLKEYNKDTAMTEEGILFVEDAMNEDYFAEVVKLQEGEVSGVLELESGFFIIERLDPAELLAENYDEAALSYAVDRYYHIYTDIQFDSIVTTEPVFHKIDSSIR